MLSLMYARRGFAPPEMASKTIEPPFCLTKGTANWPVIPTKAAIAFIWSNFRPESKIAMFLVL